MKSMSKSNADLLRMIAPGKGSPGFTTSSVSPMADFGAIIALTWMSDLDMGYPTC